MEKSSNKDFEVPELEEVNSSQAKKIMQLSKEFSEISDDYLKIEKFFQKYPEITCNNELFLTNLRIFLYRDAVLQIVPNLQSNIFTEEIFDEIHKDFVTLLTYEKVMLFYLKEIANRELLSWSSASVPIIDQESVHRKISNHNIQRHKDCLQKILNILEQSNHPIDQAYFSNHIFTDVLKDGFKTELISRRKQAAQLHEKIVDLRNNYRKVIGLISSVNARNEATIMLYVLILSEIQYTTFWKWCGGFITDDEWLEIGGSLDKAMGEAQKYYCMLEKDSKIYIIDGTHTSWAVHFVNWNKTFIESLIKIKVCHPELNAK